MNNLILIKINPIAVKDKNDVVKALTILEKLGIHRMSDEQKQNYLLDDTKTVENNFMIQEKDGGFRIQSHYIGSGISIESLEKQVNNLLEKHPNLCDLLNEIKSKVEETQNIIKNAESNLNELNTVIELKEEK